MTAATEERLALTHFFFRNVDGCAGVGIDGDDVNGSDRDTFCSGVDCGDGGAFGGVDCGDGGAFDGGV